MLRSRPIDRCAARHPGLRFIQHRKAWTAARSLCPGLFRIVAMTLKSLRPNGQTQGRLA
jgi:hypothetical protein